MKLLHIDSSARSSSISRKLTARFAEEWKKNHPEGEVTYRDLSITELPQITDHWGATYVDESKHSPAQRDYLSVSDSLIEELQAADTVVIGAPMYNFSISSLLKAWIDQIVRRGKTVEFRAEGPRGLLGGKEVVVITSRGGSYEQGSPTAPFDFQEPYLRAVFGFIGLNATFVHAEKQGRPDAETTFAAAAAQISRVAREQTEAMRTSK